MIPVLSRTQMRAFDAHAIESCRVPGIILMENAGRGAADVVVHEALGGTAEGKRVVVVCGTGNNGGDGFVVARHLFARGAIVDVCLAGNPAKMTDDCRTNHDAFTGLGGHVREIDLGAPIDTSELEVDAADIVIDALFGTGLDRAIGEPLATIVRAMNEGRANVVALDVPSGLNADTGEAMGATVQAELTVTFAQLKLGHVTPNGVRHSGSVRVVDIGVPAALRSEHAAGLVEGSDVRRLLAPRAIDSHKYRAGHVAILAGSAGKIGAALLCASGAMRAGAGAATITTWPDAAAALDMRVLEIMTARIETGSGEELDALLVNKRALVMGPGFGTDERARAVVRHVLASYTGPIVADADALTVHARALEDFASAGGRAILTPHAGELARLLGTTSEGIEADRFGAVCSAAARANAVVLLKGPFTAIAAPDGRVVVNSTGNPALATAGSGDVLAGIIGALACTLPPFAAAWCGAYLHGAAGDAWAEAHADRGLLAGEIADHVPRVIDGLLSDDASAG